MPIKEITEEEGYAVIPEDVSTVIALYYKGGSLKQFIKQTIDEIDSNPTFQRCLLLFEKGVSRKMCLRITDKIAEILHKTNGRNLHIVARGGYPTEMLIEIENEVRAIRGNFN